MMQKPFIPSHQDVQALYAVALLINTHEFLIREVLQHVLHGILDNRVPRRLAGDFYCLQYWNTGADQSSQRPAKPGHGNLLNYVTQFHREFEPNPIPHLRTGPGILEPPDSVHQQEDQRKDYEPECSQEITQKYH